MRRLLLCGAMLTALAGCAVYGPGPAPDPAFAAAASDCDSAALVRYPPMTMGVPGYFSTPNEFCSPTSGGTNCMIISDGYLPQVQSAGDTNAPPRQTAFRSCMTAKGWKPADQANGEIFIPPGGAPEGVVSRALSYCEARLGGPRNTGPESARFHQCVVTRARELEGPRPPA